MITRAAKELAINLSDSLICPLLFSDQLNYTADHVPAARDLTDAVQLPRLQIGWLTARFYTQDDADLYIALSILGGHKAIRLETLLGHDKRWPRASVVTTMRSKSRAALRSEGSLAFTLNEAFVNFKLGLDLP